MRFKESILDHLCHYKSNKLGIKVSGIFRGREYGHILPWDLRMKNLLSGTRSTVSKNTLVRITLHSRFHHLNSPQAMCLNFFAPIINSPMLNVILPDDLAASGYKIMAETAVFEMPSTLDNVRDEIPTTFDFFVQAKSQEEKIANLYVVIKYTETGFGKAKNDEKHTTRIKKLYLPLARSSQTVNPDYLNIEQFSRNYKLMRNLVPIAPNSYVIFIYPGNNLPVEKEVIKAWLLILKPDAAKYLHFRNWEKLIADIANFPDFKAHENHYVEFVEKYLPWVSRLLLSKYQLTR